MGQKWWEVLGVFLHSLPFSLSTAIWLWSESISARLVDPDCSVKLDAARRVNGTALESVEDSPRNAAKRTNIRITSGLIRAQSLVFTQTYPQPPWTRSRSATVSPIHRNGEHPTGCSSGPYLQINYLFKNIAQPRCSHWRNTDLMFAVHQRNISSLTSSARTGETRSKRIQCALDPRRTERVNGILCTLSLSLYLPRSPSLSVSLSHTLVPPA